MSTRSRHVEDRLRNTYWFVPMLMLVATAVLAKVTTEVDESFDPEELPWLRELVYSGGPDGAREILGTIASSMITVAGVVFSVTIVGLQLASSQFGPRMLMNFVRDRANQVTLGTFVSSFLFSLLVLRSIRSADPGTVPHLSVSVALLIALGGLSVLVYFIHHIATAIQAPNLVYAISKELVASADHLFPNRDDTSTGDAPVPGDLPDDFDEKARGIDANSSGFVQAVEVEDLVRIAREHDLVVRLDTRPGRFVVHHTRCAKAYPTDRVGRELEERLADTVITGSRRTFMQDIEFPIKQMVEIAVRCLSPAINDPFTASTCVDHMSVGLSRIAGRELRSQYLTDETGALRVVISDPVTFERLVRAAFDQVRQAASFHTQVYLHMLDALARVAGSVVDPHRLEPLLAQGRLVVEAAERKVEAEADQELVEERYDALVGAVDSARRQIAGRG